MRAALLFCKLLLNINNLAAMRAGHRAAHRRGGLRWLGGWYLRSWRLGGLCLWRTALCRWLHCLRLRLGGGGSKADRFQLSWHTVIVKIIRGRLHLPLWAAQSVTAPPPPKRSYKLSEAGKFSMTHSAIFDLLPM